MTPPDGLTTHQQRLWRERPELRNRLARLACPGATFPPSPPRPTFLRSGVFALQCRHNHGKDTSDACGGCGGSKVHRCAVHGRVVLSRCMNCPDFAPSESTTP